MDNHCASALAVSALAAFNNKSKMRFGQAVEPATSVWHDRWNVLKFRFSAKGAVASARPAKLTIQIGRCAPTSSSILRRVHTDFAGGFSRKLSERLLLITVFPVHC